MRQLHPCSCLGPSLPRAPRCEPSSWAQGEHADSLGAPGRTAPRPERPRAAPRPHARAHPRQQQRRPNPAWRAPPPRAPRCAPSPWAHGAPADPLGAPGGTAPHHARASTPPTAAHAPPTRSAPTAASRASQRWRDARRPCCSRSQARAPTSRRASRSSSARFSRRAPACATRAHCVPPPPLSLHPRNARRGVRFNAFCFSADVNNCLRVDNGPAPSSPSHARDPAARRPRS